MAAKFDVDVNDLIDNGQPADAETSSPQPAKKHSHPPRSTAKAPVAADGKNAEYQGPWRLTVTGSVTETGGRAVTTSRTVEVDRVGRYLALRPHGTAPQPAAPCAFDCRLVSPAGEVQPVDATLDYDLYRETWNSSYVWQDSRYHFQSTRILEPIHHAAHNIQNGAGQLSVTPPAAGSYVLSRGTARRISRRRSLSMPAKGRGRTTSAAKIRSDWS